MNNDGISYIKLFNQVVDEFFRELINIEPGETKIKVQYNLFQTICKTNVRKPCNEFMNNIILYLDKLIIKDESIFSDPENMPSFIEKINFHIIWPTLSENNKNVIWKYIKTFLIFGVHIVELPEDVVNMINYIIKQ